MSDKLPSERRHRNSAAILECGGKGTPRRRFVWLLNRSGTEKRRRGVPCRRTPRLAEALTINRVLLNLVAEYSLGGIEKLRRTRAVAPSGL